MASEHLRREQTGVIRYSLAALIFCLLVFWAGYSQVPRWFDMPTEPGARLGMALVSGFVVLLWVMLGVILVSAGRFFSDQDVAGSAFALPSPAISVKAAFLQNTLEQAVLAMGIYVILARWLSGPGIALIPTSAFLFSIGRAAFLFGYIRGARGRSFGMATTMLPTMALYALAAILMLQRD